MKITRLTGGTAAVAALALALSACAGTDTESEPDAPAGPQSTATEQDPMPPDDEDHTGHDMTEDMTEDMTDDATEMPEAGGDLSAVMPEGTGNPFADARMAAHHMPETGATFAGGFVTALDIEGDPTSEAAELRSELTYLLQEHVYLAGMGIATAYVAGPESDEFSLAAEQIDANSVDLAALVGELAGEEAEEEFLTNWRSHIDYFVDYALAAASEDQDGMNAAVEDLRGYTQDAGMFFEEISGGELPAEAVTASLDEHVDTLAMAVDALAAGDTEAYAHLKHAADHVVVGAAVLSTGLATATGLEGDPNDPASELRAALTANLNEHVYLAGIAVFVAYTSGIDSEQFAAAADVVDVNAVQLADAVGILAGEDQREPFLELWRDHIGYFVDYAAATATGDDAAAEAALADLDQYRYDAGEFFDEITGGALPADAVADGLGMHVRSVGGVIDSLNAALVQNS